MRTPGVLVRSYPFKAKLRLSNVEGGSYEVTVDKYLVSNEMLRVGEVYDFTVEVQDERA